jgi:hypothetical protein
MVFILGLDSIIRKCFDEQKRSKKSGFWDKRFISSKAFVALQDCHDRPGYVLLRVLWSLYIYASQTFTKSIHSVIARNCKQLKTCEGHTESNKKWHAWRGKSGLILALNNLVKEVFIYNKQGTPAATDKGWRRINLL